MLATCGMRPVARQGSRNVANIRVGIPSTKSKWNVVTSTSTPVGTLRAQNMSQSQDKSSVALVSLGCPKNVVDAEVMLGTLQSKGYTVQDDPRMADVVIVNTCAFVEDAKRESINAILEAANLKGSTGLKALFVTGCLSQRYGVDLLVDLPEVDRVIGFENYADIPLHIDEVLAQNEDGVDGLSSAHVGSPTVPFRAEEAGALRRRLSAPHTAYLRVAEGCDQACSFCAIPSFRGSFRSKAFEDVLHEAEILVRSGARELCLIAEDTNQWGIDFGERDSRRLGDLLWALNGIADLRWIRLLYCYPSYFTDALMQAIAEVPKVVKYIDMPLQHASSKVLRAMRRPGATSTEELLGRLRNLHPDIVLRTTFIAGFPGESEDDFQELCDFASRWGFERGGAFAYSAEDGTDASQLPLQLSERVRQGRRATIENVFLNNHADWADSQVGKILNVMLDSWVDPANVLAEEDNPHPFDSPYAVGRTEYDAPDIDGRVLIPGCPIPLSPGTVLQCKIERTDNMGRDLVATVHADTSQ